jgi:hypothetical protein
MSDLILNWTNDSRWANEPEVGQVSAMVTLKWEEDETCHVTFSMEGNFLVMSTIYQNYQGELKSSWCLGYFIKNEYAKKYAQFVLEGYNETSSLAHCPCVLYIDSYEAGYMTTLGGDVIEPKMFGGL